MKICNWDAETGSEIDLTSVGVYVYAAHPSTRVHCLKYTFDRGKTMRCWDIHLGQPLPTDLDEALDDPEMMFEGWNCSFERIIMRDVLRIEIPIRRFRCTMARARSMALPGALGLCARALQMPVQKSDDSLMRKWMRPLPDGSWANDRKEYEGLREYCGGDVYTEIGLSDTVRDMSDEEWEDYWITEEINDIGLPVDIELAKAAQVYARDELADICGRLNAITNGKVTTPKQFQRIKDWLADWLPEEMQLEPNEKGKITFDRAVREEYLAPDNEDLITGDVREFIQLIHDGGRASTAKFQAMENRAGPDGRIRGCYVFNGAGQTNRFSATGFQPHNLTRKKLDKIEDVVEAILQRVDRDELIRVASCYDNGGLVLDVEDKQPIKQPYDIMTILSRCLRPSIVAEEGKILVWGDWSAIEARVLPWLSKENSASELLDVFARGEDVYIRQAALTYGVNETDVTRTQRQNGGKIPILSFGFGGGAGAVLAMARAYGVRMTREEAEGLKVAWRRSNPWAERFWMALETAAFNAVRDPETEYQAGRVAYMSAQDVLWCMLPSGRIIAYPFPELTIVDGRFGPQQVVTAIKGSFHPKKDSSYWPRMKLWGGFQAENCLGADTEVLTSNGWKLIIHVTTDDQVWDGIEWVDHEGLVYQGPQRVIDFGGVLVTPDHKVRVGYNMHPAMDVEHYEATETGKRFNWPEVWPSDCAPIRWGLTTKSGMADTVHLWNDQEDRWCGPDERIDAQLRLSSGRAEDTTAQSRHDFASSVLGVEIDARSLSVEDTSRLEELWRTTDTCLSTMAQIREFLGRHGFDLSVWLNPREKEQRQGIQSSELHLGEPSSSSAKHPSISNNRNAVRVYASLRRGKVERYRSDNPGVSDIGELADPKTLRTAWVYDLKNAGPRHRFAVRGIDGRPFIVSNCTQAEAASILRCACREVRRNDWPLIGHTHDELLLEPYEDEADDAKKALHHIMTHMPPCFDGLPLAAEISANFVYGK